METERERKRRNSRVEEGEGTKRDLRKLLFVLYY